MHFANSLLNVRDAAHRPGGDHRVDAAIIQRKALSSACSVSGLGTRVGDRHRLRCEPAFYRTAVRFRLRLTKWPGQIGGRSRNPPRRSGLAGALNAHITAQALSEEGDGLAHGRRQPVAFGGQLARPSPRRTRGLGSPFPFEPFERRPQPRLGRAGAHLGSGPRLGVPEK